MSAYGTYSATGQESRFLQLYTHTDFDLIEKLKTEGYGQHTLSLKGTDSLWYVYSQCHYT